MKNLLIALFLGAICLSQVSAQSMEEPMDAPDEGYTDEEMEEFGADLVKMEVSEIAMTADMKETSEDLLNEALLYDEELQALKETIGSDATPEQAALEYELITKELESLEAGSEMAAAAIVSGAGADLIQDELSVLEADSNFSDDPETAALEAEILQNYFETLEFASKMETNADLAVLDAELLTDELRIVADDAVLPPDIEAEMREQIDEDLEAGVLMALEAAAAREKAGSIQNRLSGIMTDY